MAVQPIPAGYHTVTPYLIIQGAAKAIAFYKEAFGASERFRMDCGGGKLGHAEIKIGDSIIMLADEVVEMGHKSPLTLGGAGVSILLYVRDADSLYNQAVLAGAKMVRPIQDQFYGDRSGTVSDPFGHLWTIATHKEDVPMEEVNRRFEEMLKKQQKSSS